MGSAASNNNEGVEVQNRHASIAARCTMVPATVAVEQASNNVLTRSVVQLLATLTAGPLDLPEISLVHCPSTTIAIQARLVDPSEYVPVLAQMPLRVHADRPLEIELDPVGLGPGADGRASVARWLSANSALSLHIQGRSHVPHSVPMSVYPSGDRWMARALIRPSVWAEVQNVTVVSIMLAGRHQLCDCLPAALRVGYNHAPSPSGEVCAAARTGDVPALQAALDAGGSTEEADIVRGGVWEGMTGTVDKQPFLLFISGVSFMPSCPGST